MRFRALRVLVGLVVLMGAAAPVAAQRLAPMGLMGGLDLSDVGASGPDAVGVGFGSRAGLVAGGFFNVSILGKVPLTIQALLSQKGTAIDFSGFGVTGKQVITITYFEVPVLVRVARFSTHAMTIRAEAGPSMGFKVGQKETFGGHTIGDADRTKLKGTDFGLAIGGQIDRRKLAIIIQYIFGLTNINDDSDLDATIRNRTFRIAVGFNLR